jgi:prepilin-type N-terminal cleavage/methylation domain-containing protein
VQSANSNGFSLIEVLVATFVLTVAMTATAALFSTSVLTSAGNRDRTAAVALMQDKIEELRHRKNLTPGNHSEKLIVSLAGSPQGFLRAWTIDSALPRRVTVTVLRLPKDVSGRYDELARASTLVARGF